MGRGRLAAILLAAAILACAIWGGMLNDRHVIGLDDGVMGLVGFPLAAILASMSLVMAWWEDRSAINWRSPLVWGAGGLIVWSGLSLTRTHNLSEGISTLLILVCAVCAGAASSVLSRNRPISWMLVTVLVTAAAIVSAMGVSEYAVHASGKDTSWRVFSTFTMPNFLAGYLVMLIPLIGAVYLGSKLRMVTILSAVALALSAACLLLTQSRFGLIGMSAAAVVFLVLAARSGALTGAARNRFLVILGICVVAAGLFARPVLRRLSSSQSESYSSQFRSQTWKGTLQIALHNPVIGTGLGSYDTAYARYALVGFTEHAHNSYLQAAAETGLPGALLLIVCLALPLVYAVRSARTVETSEGAPFDQRLIAVGIAAGLAGALLRNLFDSDLYVGANAVTFGVLAGLAIAMRTAPQPEPADEPSDKKRAKPRHPKPTAPPTGAAAVKLAAAVALMLFALVYGSKQALSRVHAAGYYTAMAGGDARLAREEIEAAIAADGSNADFRLNLAELLSRTGDLTGAEGAFRRAVDAAPIGKTYFRFGKFLMTQQARPAEAATMFQKAEEADPHYLQNLLLLADAYKASGKPQLALDVYRRMVRLHRGPVGRLRAVPEQIPWEFAFAYLGLAEDLLVKGDRRAAVDDLREGCDILANWWGRRNDLRNQVRTDQWTSITQKYQWALEQYATVLREQGNSAEAAKVEGNLTAYKSELETANAEREKQSAAGPG